MRWSTNLSAGRRQRGTFLTSPVLPLRGGRPAAAWPDGAERHAWPGFDATAAVRHARPLVPAITWKALRSRAGSGSAGSGGGSSCAAVARRCSGAPPKVQSKNPLPTSATAVPSAPAELAFGAACCVRSVADVPRCKAAAAAALWRRAASAAAASRAAALMATAEGCAWSRPSAARRCSSSAPTKYSLQVTNGDGSGAAGSGGVPAPTPHGLSASALRGAASCRVTGRSASRSAAAAGCCSALCCPALARASTAPT